MTKLLVRLLGLIDILTSICFWMFFFYKFPSKDIMFFFALLLLIKGISFSISKNIASISDIACSLIIFYSLSFKIPGLIALIVTLILFQKGLFSMI